MSTPVLERSLAELYGTPTPEVELVKLKGDASTRLYFRGRLCDADTREPETFIVMQLPEDAQRSDEGGAQPNIDRLPFLEVGELLAERGVPVPKVYAEDLAHGVVLLEDLGDETFHAELSRTPRSEWPELYGRAVDLLAELHERTADIPASSIVAQRRFDRELLEWELGHFREWGLEALTGPLAGDRRRALDHAFASIVDAIADMPYGFVHRDYQSKNLMVSPKGELTVIDFQDALIGPRVYDLVALLCDSYVDLDLELQDAMIARYAALRRIEAASLRREFWWVTLHRKLKDAGRFIFIDRVRKNPDFLQWFPQSLVYVGRAATQAPNMERLREVLTSSIRGFPDRVSKPSSMME